MTTQTQPMDLVGLIGKTATIKDELTVGTIVGVRIDHNCDIHIEAKWTAFNEVRRYWKPIEDVKF